MDLLYQSASIHRQHHSPNKVQVSSLISIKTGGCSEDFGYCPQAARYHTDIEGNDLMSVNQVKAQALRAKAGGSSRVCLGANSIFAGNKLLTTPNPDINQDMKLFKELNINTQAAFEKYAKREPKEKLIPPLGEKPRWTRPGHTIERNKKAEAKQLKHKN